MSDSDSKPVRPVVLQPGEGGPKPRTSTGVERTDIPAGAPRRERAVWDVALSIILMFFSLGAFLTGAVIALLGVAVFGNCTGSSCTGGGTVTTTGLVLLIVLILGMIATIAAIRLRFRGWWIAAVMLGTILIGWFLSYVLSAFGV